jgi:transcriptional regulator with XRE-family HTH domain
MVDLAVTGPGDGRPHSRPLLRTLLGEVLRRTRLEQERTLADVARAARVSMPYLSEVERGRKEASSEILAAICDALEIDLSDLLAEVGSNLAGQFQVVRLGTITSRQDPDRSSGTGGVTCLLAA